MTASPLSDAFLEKLRKIDVPTEATITGLPPFAAPLFFTSIHETYSLPVLVACTTDEEGLLFSDALAGVPGFRDIAFYPGPTGGDESPPGFTAPLESRRYDALARLSREEPPAFFLMTADVLSAGLPTADAIRRAALHLQPGGITYDQLRDWLPENGYEAVSLVTEPGTFAVRGSVIDCYPVNLDTPLRLDFHGDDLEDIRLFDIHSQISAGKRPEAVVLSLDPPASDRIPIFDFYPAGWILVTQESEEIWSITSCGLSTSSRRIELGIEAFSSDGMSTELIVERWRLIQQSNPDARAFFASPSESQYRRASEQLGAVPLVHSPGAFPAGFYSSVMGLMVVTTAELWRWKAPTWRPVKRKSPSLATHRRHIETLEPGNPVVHLNYGIGRYQGLTRLQVGPGTQECLTIEYEGGDRVHVSTDKISLVFPYSVPEGQSLQLDSLRSTRWERVKRQTRRSAEQVVDQLVELYARRSLAPGIIHPADDDLQAEMEASFSYEDTPDQSRATDEIKRDMEHARPMDRLLSGDVGFGKTEVAWRAAFKAICGGHQTALIAPTTILVDQHFISARARLEPFAVNVQMISRFVPPARQRKILSDLAGGSVDLIIGTHRLISKDVHFKNLGLLIIDEEHRFGVRQKERIKQLRTDVDVLSLSATPIPRTLHLSLAGIRDISRLDTPPLERIPIITSIQYFSWEIVRRVILKELDRGGQVYFVHNEVKTIDRMADELRQLLPETDIGVAHGQIEARQLESTMLAFSEGSFPILVCSSIIESGIDLPNVNTVIIHNAHKFGLAQIYQIRGRVGRSSRQAHAYLLIPRRPSLTQEATRRLKTIERHTALGSGYAIALKDLEIRGTGNIFGLEQSGHIAAVGLDLYTRIIQGVIHERNLKPGADRTPFVSSQDEVTIRIFPDAGIPATYVPDPHLRLNLYRRLATMDDSEHLVAFHRELQDRFGEPPPEVHRLLDMVQLRQQAAAIGVRTVRVDDKNELVLDFIEPEDPAELLKRIRRVLELEGWDYRFSNMKTGDLRLSITGLAERPYPAVGQLFHGLMGTKRE